MIHFIAIFYSFLCSILVKKFKTELLLFHPTSSSHFLTNCVFASHFSQNKRSLPWQLGWVVLYCSSTFRICHLELKNKEDIYPSWILEKLSCLLITRKHSYVLGSCFSVIYLLIRLSCYFRIKLVILDRALKLE